MNAPTAPPLNRQILLGAFREILPPNPVSLGYRLSLALVLFMMTLLPLVYLGMIGLIIGGVIRFNVAIRRGTHGSADTGEMFFTLLSIFVGTIAVAFLIKPLIASAPKSPRPLSVTPLQEPLLFDLIKKICDLVGAEMPKRVDIDCKVNASASFGRGWKSLFSRDLVLTVGLPLVAGFSVQNLAGVLSHEFGHFAQGAGMRASYLIRSINFWFARVVYERDGWDEMLEECSEKVDIRIGIFFYLLRFLVWLMRRVLWVLMWIAHAFSMLLLRHMEYDADQYEVRVVGSQGFRESTRKLPVLNASWHAALALMQEAWTQRRRVDDLSGLVALQADSVPNSSKERIIADALQRGGTLLDTHPPDQRRIDRALRNPVSGIFSCDVPAKGLFRDFDGLSKKATLEFYRASMGDEVLSRNAVGARELLGVPDDGQSQRQALERVTEGLFNNRNPLFLGSDAARPPENEAAHLEELRGVDQELSRLLGGAREKFSAQMEQEHRIVTLSQIAQIQRSRLKFRPAAFNLKSANPEELDRERGTALRKRSELLNQLAPVSRLLSRRLTLLLRLASAAEAAPGTPGLPALISGQSSLQNGFPTLRMLAESFEAVGPLFESLNESIHNEALIETVQAAASRWRTLAASLGEKLGAGAYLYAPAGDPVTLAGFILGELPHSEDLGGWISTANGILDRFYTTYGRIMSELIAVAEREGQRRSAPRPS